MANYGSFYNLFGILNSAMIASWFYKIYKVVNIFGLDYNKFFTMNHDTFDYTKMSHRKLTLDCYDKYLDNDKFSYFGDEIIPKLY
jgi:hypothetical protein